MSKKTSKFLLFTAIAGAAAYGAYYYLQKKDQTTPAKEEDFDDDFDDFSEDLDEDIPSAKERSYVSLNLDKAEAFATEAFQKAKEVFNDSVQQVKETVKAVTEGNSKDIIVDVPAEKVTVSEEAVTEEAASEMTEAFEENAFEETTEIPVHIPDSETIEEFFDDDDDTALN